LLSPLLQLGVRPLENGKGASLAPVGLTACSVVIVMFNFFIGKSNLYVFLEASSSLDILEFAPLDFVYGEEVGLFDLLPDLDWLSTELSLCVLGISS
jgi:hypothetical protein